MGKVVTGVTNPRDTFARLQTESAEVVDKSYNLCAFNGSGERPTPVCTVPEMIELINVLPGKRAEGDASHANTIWGTAPDPATVPCF